MTLTESFKQQAEQYPGSLSIETGQKMTAKGYRALQHRGENYNIPDTDWYFLVKQDLGGEDAIEGDWDGEKFNVKHVESGIEVEGGNVVETLAHLWLAIHE